MLYRKSELKKHKYFLKSIHGLWILPIVIINLIVPLFNFFIYKLNNNDMVIDIEKIIFFFSYKPDYTINRSAIHEKAECRESLSILRKPEVRAVKSKKSFVVAYTLK